MFYVYLYEDSGKSTSLKSLFVLFCLRWLSPFKVDTCVFLIADFLWSSGWRPSSVWAAVLHRLCRIIGSISGRFLSRLLPSVSVFYKLFSDFDQIVLCSVVVRFLLFPSSLYTQHLLNVGEYYSETEDDRIQRRKVCSRSPSHIWFTRPFSI